MALNITTIRKQGINTVTVKKECHAYRPNAKEFPDHSYLANQIKNPAHVNWGSSLPNATDPSRILPVGTRLTVVGFGPGQTRYQHPYIVVTAPSGMTFDVMSVDIGRFLEV